MAKYDCEMGDPLDMLVEECAEVIRAVMKLRRFGPSGAPNYGGIKPRDEIVQEIGDVLACVEFMHSGIGTMFIYEGELEAAKQAKLAKIKAYFRPTTKDRT